MFIARSNCATDFLLNIVDRGKGVGASEAVRAGGGAKALASLDRGTGLRKRAEGAGRTMIRTAK